MSNDDDTPATTTSTSTSNKSSNNAPGSLLGYFINRKIDSTSNQLSSSNNSHNVDSSLSETNKRQKHKRQSSNRKYHEMVNTGGSTYFGSVLLDDSDSDDDTPSMLRSSEVSTSNANVETSSSSTAKSWLASYQSKPSLPIPSKESNSIESSSSSWVSQAWQTVDSAKEWMLSTSPQQSEVDQTITSNWTASISTAVSNTMSSISSINPFTNDNDTSNNISQQQVDTNSSTSKKQYSPTKSPSNKFDWSTKPSNPYQAVIGRGDTDILLYSSYPSSYYSYSFSWIHNLILNWTRVLSGYLPPLHWITNYQQYSTSGQLLENDSKSMSENEKQGRELLQLSMSRKKSQPSEASVQAVKNLLLLVQQQVAEEEEEAAVEDESENVEESGDVLEEESKEEDKEKTQGYPSLPLPAEPTSSPTSPPNSPKSKPPSSPSMIPTLSTPNPLGMATPTPLNEEDPNVSFDSEPSYDASLHSLTPARASPGVHKTQQSVEPFSPISLRRANSSPFIDNNNKPSVMENSSDKNSNLEPSNHNNTPSSSSNNNNHQALHAEMAARLAEGTLRAYRDLALDEATELHSALHHWTIRWERPFLGWLEAGPTVWFSEIGYSPHLPGKKVSQLQAVLARRCAVIGELQQHLWRANWRKGVAEWGMLGGGVGGEWASVVGELGGMEAPSSKSTGNVSSSTTQLKIFNHSNLVGTNVSNLPGGGIVVDQDDMTMWSIDAMRVIRDQLYRALPNSKFKELPFVEHWPRERRHFGIGEVGDNEETTNDLPTWAQDVSSNNNNDSHVIITDLNKMSIEVTALLQSIEIHLEQQRVRRLNRLRPPSRLRRRWYFVAAGIPIGAFVLHKLTKEHGGIYIVKRLISKIGDIYRDHVSEPINSIYQELFTPSGRLDVTDRKARVDAIESLKRMIRSWLEENMPTMPETEMIERSEAMDISLIEEKMEESIKHIYEINSVVRMSLIEMQFIKKELLSALVSMDELMGSNEINMQIAAMTPALMLLLAIRKGFRLLFYAVFQMGKSKEEIYSSFRQTILDIERLLLMRDNPPPPPNALEWGSSKPSTNNNKSAAEVANTKQNNNSQTLSAEDLGMLLLHIHECRNILWQSRRRFRSDVLRNVAEDLAELAGERGPVSVTQQLHIISRMSRTYPFMKVISSSVPFEMIIPGTG